MPAETWRLLAHDAADGATNMATDEAIMRAVAAGDAPPTLRFYRWQPACLSLGRFQRHDAEARAEECRADGVDIVRRPTGGRLLLHETDAELTYSLCLPLAHPLAAGSIREVYRRISLALLAGLHRLGVTGATLAPALRDDPARHQPGRPRSGACFDTPSDHEITAGADHRKLIGSAQWRHAGGLLQHGAILLHPPDTARLYRLAHPPRGLTPTEAAAALAARTISLADLLPSLPTVGTVVDAVAAGVAGACGVRLVAGELGEAEVMAVRRMREVYMGEGWTVWRDRVA